MWLVDELEQFYTSEVEAAQKRIGTTAAAAPAPEAEVKQQITVWDFRANPALICSFLGEGVTFTIPGTDPPITMGTYKFKVIGTDTIVFVPKWDPLDQADGNFLGFAKEDPAAAHQYMLQFRGREGNQVQMKIFKK